MIRTFITPTKNNYNVALDLPDDYLGVELELLVFKKQEGLVKGEPKATMADFWNVISDETAKKLHDNVDKMRSEWERDI
jgi:hypothetical protein